MDYMSDDRQHHNLQTTLYDMSGLGYKLGQQGRQILNSNNVTAQDSYGAIPKVQQFQLPTELDYLLYDIANPKPSTSADKVFSYLVHYYPRLKSSVNIQLLTKHFLRCPLFFSSLKDQTLENITKIIECYQYIITTKYKVSNPTISFHEFYISIYDSIRDVLLHDSTAHWKILPVLAGCISSISSMELYNPCPSHHNVIAKVNKLELSLFSDSFLYVIRSPLLPGFKDNILVSLIYTQEHLSSSFYAGLTNADPEILPELMRILFFSKYGLDKGSLLSSNISYNDIMRTKPILRQLNKWAFLFGKIAKASKDPLQNLKAISRSLDYIVSFAINISNAGLETLFEASDKWDLVKYIFFTVVMIFEHATREIVLGTSRINQFAFMISNQILRSFFYLSYVLDQIGTGGFDSYNFIFDSTTSLLGEYNPDLTESLLYSMLNEIPVSKRQTPANESKLNYFFRTTEATLQSLKKSFKETTLFPLMNSVFDSNDSSAPTVEFCHSIMVKHLNLLCMNLSESENEAHLQEAVFSCFNRVLAQFPKNLSLNQTSLITQTCGKAAAISSPNDPEFLNTLLDLVRFQINMSAYTPLPPRISFVNGDRMTVPEKLCTRRAGLISIYIDNLQFTSINSFTNILEDIKHQIDNLVGSQDVYFLYDVLWDNILLVNKYDCQKGQIGIDWWYRRVNKELVPKL